MILKVNGETVHNYKELTTELYNSGIDTASEVQEWIGGLDEETLQTVGDMFMDYVADALDFIGWFF